MSQKYILAPSILSADFLHLGEQIAACEAAGADWIHVDVMDGHFVPNLTMGPFIVEACRRATKLPLDVHLMVESPERLLEAFAKAGTSHLTVHVETCPNLHSTLQEIRALGCAAGVTLNPGTPVTAIEPVLHMIDLLLVMTVNPGYSKQTFLPETTSKVAALRRMLDSIGSSAWLEVDGGISAQTLPEVRKAGANAFVAAHAVFDYPEGIAAGIAVLRKQMA
ncbi:MAG: ribulose-phosphate 3-epimerase [Anaerolineales bacterium]|nr:ribulose-phosphate 3-epimerase [Anaerolineales bacterium]